MQLVYTENEGEEVKLWPTWKGPTLEDLNKLERHRGRFSIQVEYMGIKIHEVIFPDFTRWDAHNGYTGKVDEMTIDYFNNKHEFT